MRPSLETIRPSGDQLASPRTPAPSAQPFGFLSEFLGSLRMSAMVSCGKRIGGRIICLYVALHGDGADHEVDSACGSVVLWFCVVCSSTAVRGGTCTPSSLTRAFDMVMVSDGCMMGKSTKAIYGTRDAPPDLDRHSEGTCLGIGLHCKRIPQVGLLSFGSASHCCWSCGRLPAHRTTGGVSVVVRNVEEGVRPQAAHLGTGKWGSGEIPRLCASALGTLGQSGGCCVGGHSYGNVPADG